MRSLARVEAKKIRVENDKEWSGTPCSVRSIARWRSTHILDKSQSRSEAVGIIIVVIENSKKIERHD